LSKVSSMGFSVKEVDYEELSYGFPASSPGKG